MKARLARLRDAGGDAGVSITELVVTVMVSSLVLAMVGSMYVNVALITNNSNATTQRNGVAANVMNEVSSVVRTAAVNPVSGSTTADPAIVSGTPTSLTVYSFVDTDPAAPAPSKVTFRFDGSMNLVEDRWTASKSGTYWVFTGSAFTRTLGGPMLNLTGTDAFFVYLDANGAVITPGTNGLTLAQRNLVASVKITVRIDNQPTTGADPIQLVSTIGMPNVQISGGN